MKENTKRESKQKWTEMEYHLQEDYGVAHKAVKMFCNTDQFPSLPFCGPHTKPHDVRGLSKHYNMRFDTKLGHGIFAIIRIHYACDKLTPILDKPFIHGLTPQKQLCYQPVIDCT